MAASISLNNSPGILSDSLVLFLDPHVSHLSKMGASSQKPGIKLRFLKVKVSRSAGSRIVPFVIVFLAFGLWRG